VVFLCVGFTALPARTLDSRADMRFVPIRNSGSPRFRSGALTFVLDVRESDEHIKLLTTLGCRVLFSQVNSKASVKQKRSRLSCDGTLRGKVMKTRRFRILSALFVVAPLTLVALGCGSGSGSNYSNPESSITATQNPLVAQYNVTVPRPEGSVWVEFGADTSYGRQTSVTLGTAGYGQTVPILVAGMLPSTSYHMRAHVDWYPGLSWVDQDRTFTTGTLSDQPLAVIGGAGPLKLPTLTVTRPTASLQPSGGVELVDLISQGSTHLLDTFVTDLQGNIIWYYDVGAGNYAFPIRPMPNGHFIVCVGAGLEGVVLREIDLAGNTIREISVEQINQGLQQKGSSFGITTFHHDVIVLPNGHWIALAQSGKYFTDLPGYPGSMSVTGDVLLDIDLNGNVVWTWSAFDYLDVNRHPFGLPDWTHSNAIVYTPNDGNLLLSMRDQSWILKIDYENGSGLGDILWRLGYQGDFAIAGDDPRQWFYGQHFPSPITINGPQMTLAVVDDGNLRVLDSRGEVCGTLGNEACYSRATVYQIDESTKTASLDWQFSPGLYTFWGGSINQLANGNVEFDLSEPFPQDPTSSLVTEVSQTANPAVVWQMNIQGSNAYRAYRIPSLYPGVTWQ
jgi:arylsulfate sulfotransferase